MKYATTKQQPKWNYQYKMSKIQQTHSLACSLARSHTEYAAKISTSKYYLFGFVSAMTYCQARTSVRQYSQSTIHNAECIVRDSTFKCTFNGMTFSAVTVMCEYTNLPKRIVTPTTVFNDHWEIGEKKIARIHTHTHTVAFVSESFGLEICHCMVFGRAVPSRHYS